MTAFPVDRVAGFVLAPFAPEFRVTVTPAGTTLRSTDAVPLFAAVDIEHFTHAKGS